MKKVASFTLIELVVAMLISAIVVAFSFYSYSLVNRQLDKFIAHSVFVNGYFLFKKRFHFDISAAQMVEDTTDNMVVLSNSEGRIYYKFDSTITRRTVSGKQDSFPFGGIIKNVRYVSDSLHVINQLDLLFFFKADTLVVFESKSYSAQDLISAKVSRNE